MSAQCEQIRRSSKTSLVAGTSMGLLGAGLSLLLSLSSGCTKVVVCKAETMAQLPKDQYCADCKPLDHELLDRLNTTELPWPVRKAVDDCADAIRHPEKQAGSVAMASTRPGIVTKGALRRCLSRNATLDAPTQSGLVNLINKSNLAEDEDQTNFYAKCDAALPVSTLPPPVSTTPPVSTLPPASPIPGSAPDGLPPAAPASATPPAALPAPAPSVPPPAAPVLPPPPAM
jgi:hypothetical protein